jgi:tRNA threonylcarbamoyladenosine biosynthesis protein TsaB
LALVLNIETSTTLCSVSLAESGKVITIKEANEGYTHAENLHVFIEKVLAETGKSSKDLNAIAVGSGPGSYTGLRIGVSSAKGMAYALQIPLIAVNSLQIMAFIALPKVPKGILLCPMLDARRMEVYTAILDSELKFVKETSAQILEEKDLSYFETGRPACFFGEGMSKCKALLEKIPGSSFLDDIVPSSSGLAELSYQKFRSQRFEDVAYFEPFYLKDFLIKEPKKSHR